MTRVDTATQTFWQGFRLPWRKRRSEADRKVASQAEALLDISRRNIEIGRSINSKVVELNNANKRAQAAQLLEISGQIIDNNQRLLEVVGTALTKSD